MDFKKLSQLIMIEQTVFALPFAYLGILFAGGGKISTWIFASVALVAARTAGMCFNRVIDADIDAKNPRTKDRLLPRGEVTRQEVLRAAVVSCVVFVFASYMLNMLCFYLSFVAIALLISYSYFKRFSSASHLYLGFVEAAAPIGGYLATTGEFALIPFILGFAIMTWIAGLDVVYALLDIDFDRNEGLHSIPAQYGKDKALIISALLYVLSFASLIAAGVITSRKEAYWIGVLCVGIIFIYQQKLARSKDLEHAIKEFFKVNSFISPVLFISTFVDVFFIM
ncbi:MAG: putative 4-hydroxybenzoate polyprenyltransferase [Spirochaetes bacterium]|nr:putative 4-hydroxybenzoate polyprenyltransferase [Spirochaetota bacterium]